jgi:hypothetical protein
MDRPGRMTVQGALAALLLAENGGDIVDEVNIICDALGIARPDFDEEHDRYRFACEAPDER